MKSLSSWNPSLWIRLRRITTSVRFRLTLWYGGILALVLVSFSAGVYLFLVNRIDAEVTDTIQQTQQHLVQEAQQSPEQPRLQMTFQGSAGNLSAVYKSAETGSIRIFGPQKPPKNVNEDLQNTLFTNHGSCNKTGNDHFLCIVPVPAPHGAQITLGALAVQGSYEPLTHAESILRNSLIAGVPLSILIALAGGWILASRALAPVEDLRRTAQSITATDLSRRIDLERDDELGRLAATLDDMIQRLDTAFREQRQLAADVSHELRTPLAVIQAQASLALRRERSPREYESVIASIQEEADRMSRIVGDLLTLARAEAGQETITRGPVRLDRVARWGVDRAQNVAESKRVSLRLAAAPAMAEGDEDRLRQLVLNLIDNAIKYTAAGGAVVVSVQTVSGDAVLRVADTGEGIPPECLPHIFQRFYRGDRARPRGEGSSGLGLAIARWVVDAHGGEIDVKSEVGKGSVFTVRLPALTPERAALTA